MHINPRSEIAGQPALEIREFLRRTKMYSWGEPFTSKYFNVSITEAQEIIEALQKNGYIEHDLESKEKNAWKTTLKGNALALASAASPILRSTAEKKVKEFLDRVKQLNESDYYLYRVVTVVVFGSFLTERDRINDIDLAVELRPRFPELKHQRDLEEERIKEAFEKGRRFANIIDQLFWPQKEALMFLKSRSRAISLHGIDDGIVGQEQTKVIFSENSRK